MDGRIMLCVHVAEVLFPNDRKVFVFLMKLTQQNTGQIFQKIKPGNALPAKNLGPRINHSLP